ncbi:MAG: 50S ribosomal protein L9 [Alphaproteobacteria bacterium]|nr:50S ribosomal protein L9 [Alphaproteobacteria bacterium]
MEVILLQRVEKLGKMGDVVNVRTGYARNFLLPKKVALRATKENISHFDKEKATLEKLNVKHKEEAEILGSRLEDSMAVLIRQASESGQLYGSISARDIATALNNEHITKNNVKIDHPIKTIGIHTVRLQLHPEVSVQIKVNAAMSEDEAKAQAKTFEHLTTNVEEKNEEKKAKETKEAKADKGPNKPKETEEAEGTAEE